MAIQAATQMAPSSVTRGMWCARPGTRRESSENRLEPAVKVSFQTRDLTRRTKFRVPARRRHGGPARAGSLIQRQRFLNPESNQRQTRYGERRQQSQDGFQVMNQPKSEVTVLPGQEAASQAQTASEANQIGQIPSPRDDLQDGAAILANGSAGYPLFGERPELVPPDRGSALWTGALIVDMQSTRNVAQHTILPKIVIAGVRHSPWPSRLWRAAPLQVGDPSPSRP